MSYSFDCRDSSDEENGIHQSAVQDICDIKLGFKELSCKNNRCGQQIVCAKDGHLFCSWECYTTKLERDQVDVSTEDIHVKRLTIKGKGGTGLLNSLRHSQETLKICVSDVSGRTVTVTNCKLGTTGQRRKSCIKKKISDSEVSAKIQDKKALQVRLKELCNSVNRQNISSFSEDETSTSLSSDEFEWDSPEVPDCNAGVNECICPPHPPVYTPNSNNRLQGYVINIVSPWELYLKTAEMIEMTEEINRNCNQEIDTRLVINDWLPDVGNYCSARYENEMYRAKIIKKLENSVYRVRYVDYGNERNVSSSDIRQLNPLTTLIPEQCIVIRLSNIRPIENNIWNSDVIQFLIKHLDGAVVEVEIEYVERGTIHEGKLSVVSSLSGAFQGDLGEILVQERLAGKTT